MKQVALRTFLALAFAPIAFGQSNNEGALNKQCTLTLAQAPTMRGFRLDLRSIDNNSLTPQQKKTSQSSKPKQFTINRECDGGLCHFEIVSFNYGRNSSISVGRGDSSLFYYFSVQITKGKLSKEYIYSDGPERHFVEKQGGQRVDATLNRLLLDVHDLGNYIVDRDIAIRNRKFSETGRFAVLASLRTHF